MKSRTQYDCSYISVPIEIDGGLSEALRPVRADEGLDQAVRATFRHGVVKWPSGRSPVRVRFDPRETYQPPFDDMAIGASIELHREATIWDNWITLAMLVFLYCVDVGVRRLMGLS